MAKDAPATVKKTERAVCYKARDAFYECSRALGKDTDSKCQDLRKAFEDNCPAAWVSHFDKRQVYNAYKQKLVTAGVKELGEE